MIDLPTMIERMSCQPARAFNLPGGTLAEGGVADVTVFDPEAEWTVDASRVPSRRVGTRRSTGWELRGRPRYTIVDGRIVWEG